VRRDLFKITVQTSPNAGRNEIIGWQGERLKIKVKAHAVDGQANEDLRRFLADLLEIHLTEITIERGTNLENQAHQHRRNR